MKKTLLFLHKWLGVGLALLFLVWFASGLVLYFVPFPALSQHERIAGARPLAPGPHCCLSAQQAAEKAGLQFTEARLGMRGERPVWRLLTGGAARQWRCVDARDGALLPALSLPEAMAVASAFSGRRAVAAAPLERDQWTVAQGFNPHRPLARVELDGDDGLELYVALRSGEVVLDTRRAERAWNWVGAVPHWIYFTELRRRPEAWHNVVVWVSIPAVVLALSGLALGVWQLFLNRSRWIPYKVFWMRWHHILGLAAGVTTLTWIFSGLLSMNPFALFSPRSPAAAERLQWSGSPAPAQLAPAAALAAAPGLAVTELEPLAFNGQAWYRLRGRHGSAVVRAGAERDSVPAHAALPGAEMRQALLRLRTAPPATVERLDAYDDLYYAQDQDGDARHARPLPVWRAQWTDGVAVYADAASGRIVLRADASTRWQRVLYNGLHSFDFAPLRERPWLRDAIVILFSLLGAAMSVTACYVAWRVLAPKARRR